MRSNYFLPGLALLVLVAGCGESPDLDLDSGGVDGGEADVGARDGGDGGPSCVDGCLVGGTCFPDGTANPANPCEACEADVSATTFSPLSGNRCDDGAFCTTDDICTNGICEGTPRTCGDAIACNGAEACDEDGDACIAGAPTCAGGEVCDALSGECGLGCSGCLIDGTCYGDGQVDRLDPCRVCDVAVSRSAWSDNDGASCDDGDFCSTGDICALGACVPGAPRACDDGVACNGVELCDEDADACAVGSSTCGSGEVCDVASGACTAACTGCVVDGICYGAGQLDPANTCRFCEPTASRTDFSPNAGARCDDGLFCTTGDVCTGTVCGGAPLDCDDDVACTGAETCDEASDSCTAGTMTCGAGQLCDMSADACVATCSGCVIGGVCYGSGQASPTNPCQMCDPLVSATAFTNADGAACDDGLFCTTGDVCALGVCGGSARACGDGVDCNGSETCDEAADRCAEGTTSCAAGTICDPSADACVATCGGCVVGGICYASGTVSPSDACWSCQPGVSSSAFTPRTGASCDDGLFCTTGETCSATGVCGGGTARVCADGVSCNGAESCNETSDRCVPGTSTCSAGQLCNPTTDTCSATCGIGTTLCGTTCVDTMHDPAHCGSCPTVCASGPNESPVCVGGSCSTVCTTGFADCTSAAGCETDVTTSVTHCGGCGRACPSGGTCADGVCLTTVVPGSSTPRARDGWSARCLTWAGDVCTRPQVMVECTTCGGYTACGEWHDLTRFNDAPNRSAEVFCWIATDALPVVSTGAGGAAVAPRACAWSGTHPICEASRASYAAPGSGHDPMLGLLAQESYCGNDPTLMTIECAGW